MINEEKLKAAGFPAKQGKAVLTTDLIDAITTSPGDTESFSLLISQEGKESVVQLIRNGAAVKQENSEDLDEALSNVWVGKFGKI